MRVNAVVCLFLSVTLTSTYATDQNPVFQMPSPGDCLCLRRMDVHARSSASINSQVIATVSMPECYTFSGGSQTAEGDIWFELQNLPGSKNGWVAGYYLYQGVAEQCTPTSGVRCNDTNVSAYACLIFNLAEKGNITFQKQHQSGVRDNAYAYSNIRDACLGQAVSRSNYTCEECRYPGAPGGHVCLTLHPIYYILAIYQALGHIQHVQVNEIAGGCHNCNSAHYNGWAVNLHSPTSNISSWMVGICNGLGGWGQEEGNSSTRCQFNGGIPDTSPNRTCNNSIAMEYACKLKYLADAGNITLWKQHPSGVHDNAYAYNNIRDACNGQAATMSFYNCSECHGPGAPGGYVCLNATLLQYIHALHEKLGTIQVNEVAGACHMCGSKHYQGVAVDLHNPISDISTMVSTCKEYGGRGWDEGDHVHCQFTS